MIRSAAVAALAICGFATLAQAEVKPSPLSLKPVYLQDTDPADGALMQLLGKAGVAGPLKENGISFGGLVEGSYTYAFDRPTGALLTGRVFDLETEDPTLNQIMVYGEKTVDKELAAGQFGIGARVEWMYGGDARFIHSLGLFDHYGFASPEEQFDLTQAYADIALPVGTGLKLRIGKFVTPIGQEVINPSGNALYSHSYLFGYAIPFTHTGVLGTYNLSDTLTVDAGITRGWDTSLEDNNGTIDFLGRLTAKFSDTTTGYFTIITGPDQPGDNGNYRTLFDLILTTKVGDNLTLALNADYAYEANSVASATREDVQWFGAAAYASYTICPQATLNIRGEYFNDDDGVRLGVGGIGVYEATVGLAITPFPNSALGKNLVIRPEVRYDYAGKGIFDGDHDQWTAAIDAYFKF
jgi:hypothetical protein